jgi:hypothetical protein
MRHAEFVKVEILTGQVACVRMWRAQSSNDLIARVEGQRDLESIVGLLPRGMSWEDWRRICYRHVRITASNPELDNSAEEEVD